MTTTFETRGSDKGLISGGSAYANATEVMPELAVDDNEGAPSKLMFNAALDRRDILKLFSMGAIAGATACVRRPAEKAIPYVNQPVDLVPGVATYYASTCGGCSAGCGLVVKTREGRPVKLEGNPDHAVNHGRLCAYGQAQIQGLFHPERLTGPQAKSATGYSAITWDDVFAQLAEKVTGSSRIGILTSPSSGHRHDFFKEFLVRLGAPESQLYTWESNGLPVSIAKAYELAFGAPDLPRIELSKAELVVGVGSDFQDVGTSPVFHTLGFSEAHSYKDGKVGKFVQFEANLTLTGASADVRHVIAPGTELQTLAVIVRELLDNPNSKGSREERALATKVLKSLGVDAAFGDKLGIAAAVWKELANEMLSRSSVLLAGGTANLDEQSTRLQLLAIMANVLIGAYDRTIFMNTGWVPSATRSANLKQFIGDAGKLDLLFVIDVDPIFSTPQTLAVKQAIEGIKTVVSMQDFPASVDLSAHYVLPNHHALESWGDEQPFAGYWSTRQPAVRAMTDSRQAEDALLWILATAGKPLPYAEYRNYLMKKWESIHRLEGGAESFDLFFKTSLKRGFAGKMASRTPSSLRDVSANFEKATMPEEGLKLLAPLDYRLQDGRGAHLPILQEISDSLTTIAWDSFAAINPTTMKKLGLKSNQVVRIEGPAGQFEVALYPLPGIHPDAIVVARGNGHDDSRCLISKGNGINPLVIFDGRVDPLTQQPVTTIQKIKLVATNKRERLAIIQKANEFKGREDVLKRVSLKEATEARRTKDLDDVPDLFPTLPSAEHRWGLSVDLDRCNGCGACMAACAIENNVPQVGRDQIIVGREMHWVRLDRYFYGDSDSPAISFQPVMCQQCNHAPCEAVCPVFATTHDPEGLNAMTYNRCVGTRYCGNACPYKVRRFNWWTYKWNMVAADNPRWRNPRALNPDVTVRTKGVMEKCNFCLQRLREARHKAKEEERKVVDGEIQTACQQTCPTNAIRFGNLNDPESKITKSRKDPRSFLMLGGDPEIGHYGLKTLPNVNYMSEVLHPDAPGSKESGEGHGQHE